MKEGYKDLIKAIINNIEMIIGPVAITLARKATKSILKKNKNLRVPEELKLTKIFDFTKQAKTLFITIFDGFKLMKINNLYYKI